MPQPRGLRLGQLWLWARRIPAAPLVGVGQIAVTDTLAAPRVGEKTAMDAQGWVLILGRVAFAALYRRSVTLRGAPA